MALDNMEETPISASEKTQPTKTSEFKAKPPSKAIDPSRLRESIKRAEESGEWGKTQETIPETNKQKFTEQLKNTAGMTPTHPSEVNRQNVVNLTAKVEGVSPQKVEENVQQRTQKKQEKKGFISRLLGKFRAHKIDKSMGGLGALEERRLNPELKKLSDYPGTGNQKYQEMIAKKKEAEAAKKAEELKTQSYSVASPEPEKRQGMEQEALRQLQEQKIKNNS